MTGAFPRCSCCALVNSHSRSLDSPSYLKVFRISRTQFLFHNILGSALPAIGADGATIEPPRIKFAVPGWRLGTCCASYSGGFEIGCMRHTARLPQCYLRLHKERSNDCTCFIHGQTAKRECKWKLLGLLFSHLCSSEGFSGLGLCGGLMRWFGA
jgi:hypothetical protein